MILPKPLESEHIRLRTATPDDAEFALALRLDPELNKFLKAVDPDVGKQRAWIADKMQASGDWHMIIEDLEGTRLGLVAVYGVVGTSFEWGRWILARGQPFYVAIETLVLVYDFAFNMINLEKTEFFIRAGNTGTIAIHERMGARWLRDEGDKRYFTYTKTDFESNKAMIALLRKWRMKNENSVC